jgi:TRAP-type C4-dicarboxylate transport system substrate-binding protein
MRTNGEVTIDTFYANALGYGGAGAMDALRTGVLDLAEHSDAWSAGDIPAAIYTLMYGVVTTIEDQAKFRDATRDLWDSEYERAFNARFLYSTSFGIGSIIAKKETHTWEDFQGLKIRFANPEHVEIFKRLGGVGVPIPYGEIPESIERGVIDGAHITFGSFLSLKVHEVAQWINLDAFAGAVQGSVIASDKFMSGLSSKNRKIVEEVAMKYEELGTQALYDLSMEQLAQLKAEGAKTTNLSPADIQRMQDVAYEVYKETAVKHGGVTHQIFERGLTAIGLYKG